MQIQKPVSNSTPPGNSPLAGAAVDAVTSFDAAELIEVVEGNMELLAMVVDVFLREGPEIFQQLKAAAARKDAAEIERTAHRFKGSALTLCATRASALAEQLEILGGTKRLAGVAPLVEALEQELKTLTQQLEQQVRKVSPAR